MAYTTATSCSRCVAWHTLTLIEAHFRRSQTKNGRLDRPSLTLTLALIATLTLITTLTFVIALALLITLFHPAEYVMDCLGVTFSALTRNLLGAPQARRQNAEQAEAMKQAQNAQWKLDQDLHRQEENDKEATQQHLETPDPNANSDPNFNCNRNPNPRKPRNSGWKRSLGWRRRRRG